MASTQCQCAECGGPMPPRKSKTGQAPKFCSAECRRLFNNRRMTRGAELYDYFMSGRYMRSTHAGALNTMTQMARAWRDDDMASRDGRFSWMPPDLSADPRAFDIVDKAARERKEKAEA